MAIKIAAHAVAQPVLYAMSILRRGVMGLRLELGYTRVCLVPSGMLAASGLVEDRSELCAFLAEAGDGFRELALAEFGES